MSAIFDRGFMPLSTYKCRYGVLDLPCRHIAEEAEDGWRLLVPETFEVHVSEEADSFGTLGLYVSCPQCAKAAASNLRTCDICEELKEGVKGRVALDESRSYDYCPACWERHREGEKSSCYTCGKVGFWMDGTCFLCEDALWDEEW